MVMLRIEGFEFGVREIKRVEEFRSRVCSLLLKVLVWLVGRSWRKRY